MKTILVHMKSTIRAAAKNSLFGAHLFHIYHQLRGLWLSRLSDEAFAQRSYRKFSGHELDLSNPQTFDERQWWLKIHYRDPLMTQCTDKIAVREYVSDQGYGHLLHPLIATYENPNDIRWDELPDRFYLKTNHSSATNIRCDDLATFDTKRAEHTLRLFLRRNHYALSREWNYRDITPRIMVEPIIDIPSGGDLIDYRFFCSFGTCQGIFVDVDTADEHGGHRTDARRNVYDPNWHLLDVEVTRPRITDREIEQPAAFDDMLRCAEDLSKPFPLCRVDLYSPNGDDIIFGEITFFHAGGNNRMTPPEFQHVLGDWIDFDRVREEHGGTP